MQILTLSWQPTKQLQSLSPLSNQLWLYLLPYHFLVPLTCYTCITALSRACDSCSAGAPAALSCHDSRARNLLRVPGGGRDGTGWHGMRGFCFIRVGRRREATAGVEGGCDHRHRVWNLLGWRWAVCGARIRARLVLWHREEGRLLLLHPCGLLPGPHRDPPGWQSDRDEGE